VRPRYDSDITHHSHKSPPQTRTLREHNSVIKWLKKASAWACSSWIHTDEITVYLCFTDLRKPAWVVWDERHASERYEKEKEDGISSVQEKNRGHGICSAARQARAISMSIMTMSLDRDNSSNDRLQYNIREVGLDSTGNFMTQHQANVS